MSKRPREQAGEGNLPKRHKTETKHQPPAVEEIQFARQLQQLLTFKQDGVHQLRIGITSFKAFLDNILYHKDEDARTRQLPILREFLDSEKPKADNNLDSPFLGQLWQAWSFASQDNNDHLVSSISSILALLVRVLSSLLEFRDHGILLCRTALQNQHLRLIKRGLDAPKQKEFVISPCLRLLTEVTSFDGGVLSREVYKRREQTFDPASLRRNLGLHRSAASEEDARRRPSIRSLTVRYILAHFKYLQEGAKIDILKNRPLCISLFHSLQADPTDVATDILNVTEQYVLNDDELPRSAKSMLLLQHNLERVAEVATRSAPEHGAAQRAFDWLKAVCTKPSYGILRPSGWYPPGTAELDAKENECQDAIDLGLDSLGFYDRYDRPDVRNPTLLGWLQTLRPQSDSRDCELVITCFQSAPELVAAYFAEKTIQFEPKLSNTWIGIASFMFETLKLPVPSNMGQVDADTFAPLPPQTNILLENILPRPLTQKILARCLNQNSNIITFFAVRLLILAFEKVNLVLKASTQALGSSTESSSLWREASEILLSRFSQRLPNMVDVFNAFRKMPADEEHALQREATARLLRFYYEVLPTLALPAQFDISTALTTTFDRVASDSSPPEIRELARLEMEHLITIASLNAGMRWFNKQGSLKYSPICSLLRLHIGDVHNREVRSLITHVLLDDGIVNDGTEVQALIASLLVVEQNDEDVWSFVDNCLTRVTRQPVKYVDYIEALNAVDQTVDGHAHEEGKIPSLFVAAACEQASFVIEKTEVVSWISSLLDIMQHANPSPQLQALDQEFLKISGQTDKQPNPSAHDLLQRVSQPEGAEPEPGDQSNGNAIIEPHLTFVPPPTEPNSHPELLRWAQKDLDLAVEDGDIDALILCLCSQHLDIRRQAHNQLIALRSRLPNSAVEVKDQLTILIGELVESYEQQFQQDDKPLPYVAGTFASHALHVLLEPTHPIYPKLNRYLIRSPEWRITRLPSYWLSNTLLSQPDEDDAYWKEVQWVLNWLVDGIHTLNDVDIIRRGGIFEKLMGLYGSPDADVKLIKEKVMEVLFRATCVEGGSNVLITRCGVLGWLDMVSDGKDDMAVLMKRRVLQTCDGERIRKWSGGLELDQL